MQPSEVLANLARHQLVDGYPLVVDLEKSQGCWIHDGVTNEQYLDAFTCFASWPLGYNHLGFKEPGFEAALARAAKHNLSNADVYTAEMAQFVEAFATHASPAGFDHHFWVAGGALAVENVMKAAFDWKARKLGRTDYLADCTDLSILHFKQAFHGRSGYTMSVTNTLPDKVGLFPKFPWPRVHNPYCVFDHEGNICNDIEAEEAKACAEIEQALTSGDSKVAAILIEPMQGEGGDNHFRPEFMQKLRDYADTHECLLCFDEVQTGFFGSGKPWLWQHHGVAPDVVAFGKKSQVCGMYAGSRVNEIEANVFRTSSRINSTWGGNLVDMVRSRRFIEIIIEDNLMAATAALGEHVKAGMRRIAADTDGYTNVRGMGSLLACSFADGEQRGAVLSELFNRKVIALPCGDDSVRFRLPLTMTTDEADELLNRFEASVKAAVGTAAV
ncbi:MAG: aminotransferase class III-fold pyridoxal phosphate-dependent enzyme [Phycisphaerales bacterium]|nr:aminotransferase class III-fold pyridoxal phosphate-dependent enzyme [Phycisphaerales bacterium]